MMDGCEIQSGVLKSYEGPAAVAVAEGVHTIAQAVFQYQGITAVSLPKSLEKIGSHAFYCCRELESVTIPKQVRYIGGYAFGKCDKLKTVIFEGNPEVIGKRLFYLSSQVEIVASEETFRKIWHYRGVDRIGYCRAGILKGRALYRSEKIYIQRNFLEFLKLSVEERNTVFFQKALELREKLTLEQVQASLELAQPFPELQALLLQYSMQHYPPEKLFNIEKRQQERELGLRPKTVADWNKIFRFRRKGDGLSITGYRPENTNIDLVIPPVIGRTRVVSIGKEAFSDGCFKTVTLPDTVTKIEDYAFFECRHCTSIFIPASVNHIGEGAFFGCRDLSAVAVPDGIKVLSESVFGCCDGLTSVTLPAGLKEIGQEAFLSCEALKELVIPDSVDTIGGSAFNRCSGLADQQGFVIVRDVLYEYCGTECDVAVPQGIRKISDYAFSHNKTLSSVILPDSLREIGEGAFEGCTMLRPVSIPEAVEHIGIHAFYNCAAMADENGFVIVRGILYSYHGPGGDVRIPEGVTDISWYAFERYMNIKALILPHTMWEINSLSMPDLRFVEKLYIPASVVQIYPHIFEGCRELQIHGISGSYAEAFAKKMNITFIPV